MDIELTDKAKKLLAKRGFDPVLGARPLRRTIQREIEDQLSEKILYGEVAAGELVTVDVENWDGEGKGDDAKFTFSTSTKPGAVMGEGESSLEERKEDADDSSAEPDQIVPMEYSSNASSSGSGPDAGTAGSGSGAAQPESE